MEMIIVQQANPGLGSDKYRNMLMDCDSSGPARCVNTKFLARLSSERSDFAASGINQSIVRSEKLKIHICPQSSALRRFSLGECIVTLLIIRVLRRDRINRTLKRD